MLLVIALCNSAFAGELNFATIAVVEPAEAMRYAWISGLCAALALVFTFLWVATGQKAFGWYLGTVLAASWRIGENSGHLPALLPWSGHALATVAHLLADSALLFFTVGLYSMHWVKKRPICPTGASCTQQEYPAWCLRH